MAREHPQNARPNLAPNVDGPTDLLLGEALRHLSHNRLLRWGAQRWVLGVEIVAVGVASYYALTWVLSLALGAVAAYLLLTVAYLYWYGWFINRNLNNKTLCPNALRVCGSFAASAAASRCLLWPCGYRGRCWPTALTAGCVYLVASRRYWPGARPV